MACPDCGQYTVKIEGVTICDGSGCTLSVDINDTFIVPYSGVVAGGQRFQYTEIDLVIQILCRDSDGRLFIDIEDEGARVFYTEIPYLPQTTTQFNPSTLKALYNAGTSKQIAIYRVIGSNLWDIDDCTGFSTCEEIKAYGGTISLFYRDIGCP